MPGVMHHVYWQRPCLSESAMACHKSDLQCRKTKRRAGLHLKSSIPPAPRSGREMYIQDQGDAECYQVARPQFLDGPGKGEFAVSVHPTATAGDIHRSST